MTHTVGISEMKVSKEMDDVLVTYSLGSCIGLSLYDPVSHAGGLIHCMLPTSDIDPSKANSVPEMFADTGVPKLLQELRAAGAQSGRLVAKVAGAASFLNAQGAFHIGERNYVALLKALAKHNIAVAAEDIGGTGARTMYLYLDTGRTVVRSRGEQKDLA